MTLTTSGIDYTVDVAFGIDPLAVPSGGDWVDISDFVRGFSTRRGRNHELGRTAAGVASITLDNRDRRFDPTFVTANLVPLQNQRDVEAALGANQLVAVAGAVVARTTTAGQFSQGIAGLSITAHATNTFSGATVGASAATTNTVPVEEGVTYTFAAQVKGSGAHTIIIRARWLDSGGTAISNSDSANNTVSAAAFQKFTHTTTAPTGAAFVRFQILFPTGGATQVVYADELQVEAGTTSRAWPADAPYYPDVVPMAHIRIRATYASTTYPVFYGFVEDWGQTWPAPAANGQGDAYIELQATDAFKILNVMELTSYPAAVEADNPAAYYRLAEGEASIAHDETGDHDGTYEGTVVFENGHLIGQADVPDFTNGYIALPPDVFDDLADAAMSVECWIRPENLATVGRIVWGEDVFYLVMNASGSLLFGYTPANAGLGDPQIQTGVVLSVNTWYHVVGVRDWTAGTMRLYLDGALIGSKSFGRPPTGTARTAYTISDAVSLGLPFPGRIAHVAVYPTALTENQIAAHLAAGIDHIDASQSGAAVTDVLDAVGWPAGLQDIGTGVSSVSLDPTGSALDLLQGIAEETEQGIFLMAGDNTATFIGRDELFSKVASSATFGDGSGEIPYRDLQFSYDDQDLWTEVDASGATGTHVIVTDAAAAARYGRRTLEVSGEAATDNEVADLANGLLGRYKAPAMRPQTLTMNKPAAFTQQLSRLIGDRVTIKRRPPGGGTISVDALIEGIDHDAGSDGWLTTTFALVPVEPQQFWILGDATYSVLDTTTRLGW